MKEKQEEQCLTNKVLPERTAVLAPKSRVVPSETIYPGLDLGTSQIAIATITDLKLNVASIVG